MCLVVSSGAIFGACLPYVFAALTMMAVARAAGVIIEEVRRQFREIPGLLDGSEEAVRVFAMWVGVGG